LNSAQGNEHQLLRIRMEKLMDNLPLMKIKSNLLLHIGV
jgi:hypothetical protein